MTPIDANDAYFSVENLVITPHIAFFTEESDTRSIEFAIENIQTYLDGTPTRCLNC